MDSLEGLVDIHNHIRLGIYDGAKNIKEPLLLIKGLKNLVIKKIISTSFVVQDFILIPMKILRCLPITIRKHNQIVTHRYYNKPCSRIHAGC